MIKSMTGYGRYELAQDNRKITVELKSVNHRYLDLTVKMPKKFNFFEAAIRNQMKKYIQRGKVDVFISYEDDSENTLTVHYNSELAAEYQKHLEQMAAQFQLENDIRVSTLSRYPEVLTMEEKPMDEEEWGTLLENCVEKASEQFVANRVIEGEHLYHDLMEKLSHMEVNVDRIEARAPQIIAEYREKLNAKVAELLGDKQIDESRIATEIVLFVDKICTDEETVRLRSHIKSMRNTLQQEESIGRKLDFIAQEMNREANTILSKANDLETSDIAIDLKTEIEKIREQIQNVE